LQTALHPRSPQTTIRPRRVHWFGPVSRLIHSAVLDASSPTVLVQTQRAAISGGANVISVAGEQDPGREIFLKRQRRYAIGQVITRCASAQSAKRYWRSQTLVGRRAVLRGLLRAVDRIRHRRDRPAHTRGSRDNGRCAFQTRWTYFQFVPRPRLSSGRAALLVHHSRYQ
jgi:hypothetical protein